MLRQGRPRSRATLATVLPDTHTDRIRSVICWWRAHQLRPITGPAVQHAHLHLCVRSTRGRRERYGRPDGGCTTHLRTPTLAARNPAYARKPFGHAIGDDRPCDLRHMFWDPPIVREHMRAVDPSSPRQSSTRQGRQPRPLCRAGSRTSTTRVTPQANRFVRIPRGGRQPQRFRARPAWLPSR